VFIENDLGELRNRLRRNYENYESRGLNPDEHPPVSTSHEADVMKAAEWASAVTWLRALAEGEDA
jgi:hypothetical protein